MNRRLFVAVALMAVALVVNVSAQNRARADVPFDFIVSDRVLPAGTYDISELNSSTIAVLAHHAAGGAMVQFQPTDGKREFRASMVFHKYGDRYYLYQVWGADSEGIQLHECKLEKEQALADNQASAPQEVVIALR